MEHITLKILAKELGMAPSTVSRALRDSYDIKTETKDKVKALAAKLNYHPNPYASSLRKNKSKTIAVVIPEIQNNFFSQVMNGVEEIARKKEYHVLIYLTHEAYQREADILRLLKNGRVDGLMISISNNTDNDAHLKAFCDSEIPLVFFDRVCPQINVPQVTSDDEEAAFEATLHLLKSGCQKIAFLTMSSKLSISSGRKAGYSKALRQFNLESQELIVECGPDDEANRRKISALLQSDPKPDGIFAAVEKFAINTYQVCHQLQIKIPQQLKVISFSNLPAAALFDPPLSTIVQPAYAIGYEAAAVLFKVIEKKKLLSSDEKIVIPSYLEVRESTKKKK